MAALRLTQYLVRLPDKEDQVVEKGKKREVEKKTQEDSEEESPQEYGEESGEEDMSEDLSQEEEEELEDEKMSDGSSSIEVESDDDSNPYGSDESESEDGENKKKKKKKQKKEKEVKEVPADPYLIRREATLLNLCIKHFKKRVIIFFNEKVQCHRMLILFKIFGLKACEV